MIEEDRRGSIKAMVGKTLCWWVMTLGSEFGSGFAVEDAKTLTKDKSVFQHLDSYHVMKWHAHVDVKHDSGLLATHKEKDLELTIGN